MSGIAFPLSGTPFTFRTTAPPAFKFHPKPTQEASSSS